jgi:putative ABC transport system substrate-binding protein
VKRRHFVSLVGGAATMWPVAARAQQPAMPVVGFLHSASPEPLAYVLTGFREGLAHSGFVEGKNITIESRWARGQYDHLPALAADLVQRRSALIVAGGGQLSVVAAKAAASTVPIVFVIGSDPVKDGLVASLNRPGGNITGLVNFTSLVEKKKFGLLREMVPQVTLIAMLINPTASHEQDATEVQTEARALGKQLLVVRARTVQEIDTAFANLVEQRVSALLVGGDAFFNSQRDQLIAMSLRHVIPAIYEFREYAVAGGLMSYGASLLSIYRQLGVYAGRILKGEKPADLPIIQPTKFDFVLNLITAKALGLDVPPTLLALADEVIE